MNSLPRQRLHNESNDFHCTKKRDCTQLIEKKHSIVCYVPSLLFSFPIIRQPGFLFSFLRANQNSEFRRRRTIGLSVFTVQCYPHKIQLCYYYTSLSRECILLWVNYFRFLKERKRSTCFSLFRFYFIRALTKRQKKLRPSSDVVLLPCRT